MDAPALSATDVDSLLSALRDACPTSVVERDRELAPMTTYRVGGRARVFAEIGSDADLVGLARVVSKRRVPVTVVGRGSNLLVADAGVDALVVHLGEAFEAIRSLGDDRVLVGAAASLPVVARQLTAAGRVGFEWAVGVPGSVGGAVRMNAGGHGSDMAASARAVRVVDLLEGDDAMVDAGTLAFGYRTSSVKPHHLVVAAELELGAGDPDVGQETLREIVRWRREHQPGGQNAGSVFTNPPGDSAGRLIDAAGLKGLRVGTAEVSTKHANFIQADPDGSAADIVALMREVIRRVHADAGVVLHAETRLVGFGPEESALMFDPTEEES